MKMWSKHEGKLGLLEEKRAHIVERYADIGQNNVQPVNQVVSKHVISNARNDGKNRASLHISVQSARKAFRLFIDGKNCSWRNKIDRLTSGLASWQPRAGEVAWRV